MKDYPLHPGQTSMPPQFVQIPLENYDSISKELEELRKHEVEWDLAKARIKELEAERPKRQCEFCKNSKTIFKNKNTEVFLSQSGATGKPIIDIMQGAYHLILEINYCPKCGYKLAED